MDEELPVVPVDDCRKLLDNGWTISLYRNELSSYTARAKRGDERIYSDNFSPAKALYQLTEKII